MNAVEAVSDSSRYFVLRVVDKQTGQHAFVGLGFQERTDAFDFNVGLQEFEKTLKYEEETGSQKALEEAHVDYSLKEGQTIRINVRLVPRFALVRLSHIVGMIHSSLVRPTNSI